MKTQSIREIKAQAVRDGLAKELATQIQHQQAYLNNGDYTEALAVSKVVTGLLGEILKHQPRTRKSKKESALGEQE